MTGPKLRIERPDDETLRVYVGDELVASANHDQHGSSGMDAVERTAQAIDHALRVSSGEPTTGNDIATVRNGMAAAAEDAYREYQDDPIPANLDRLIDLIPSLIAEIDEAQSWAATGRRHREAIEGRLRDARALLNDVRGYVGGHGDGEVDIWSLRETLAGRKPKL